MMQEERRTSRQLSQKDALRNGRGSLDAGQRANGGMKHGKSKNALQRQSSVSTVVQDTRRRNSNSTWLTIKEGGVPHERCTIPKSPSAGNFSCSGNIPEVPSRYQMYQPLPEQRFSAEGARATVKALVEATLGGTEYSACCAKTAKDLAESVKQAAKAQLCDRYKLVCFVAIGQVKDCEVMCASRAVWSPTADTFVEFTFRNKSLFALCVLYAVYQE